MPRCSGCNKFASLDECDPEVGNITVDDDGHVVAQVRIANACADCGNELTEANLELEADNPEAAEHVKKKGEHELSAEEESCDRDVKTEGKGRGLRTSYGVTMSVKITCSCGKLETGIGLSGYEQASAMDLLE